MKNAIGSELLFPMQCAFGSKGFASAEATPLPLMAQ